MKNSSKNTGDKSKVFVYRYYLICSNIIHCCN